MIIVIAFVLGLFLGIKLAIRRQRRDAFGRDFLTVCVMHEALKSPEERDRQNREFMERHGITCRFTK